MSFWAGKKRENRWKETGESRRPFDMVGVENDRGEWCDC